MTYKHLSQAVRYQIHAFMKAGHDQSPIAKVLDRSRLVTPLPTCPLASRIAKADVAQKRATNREMHQPSTPWRVFLGESKMALEKIRAYTATDYRLGHADKDIVLAFKQTWILEKPKAKLTILICLELLSRLKLICFILQSIHNSLCMHQLNKQHHG